MELTELSIEQMNEVIALFDGWEVGKKEKAKLFKKGMDYCFNAELKYHTSWDWIMPVIEKCRVVSREKQREYKSNGIDLNDPKGWKAWSYRYIDLTTDINEMFERVYKFIQWYNQQINKP